MLTADDVEVYDTITCVGNCISTAQTTCCFGCCAPHFDHRLRSVTMKMLVLPLVAACYAVVVGSFRTSFLKRTTRTSLRESMYEITVIEPGGNEKTLSISGENTILAGLDAAGVDAPFSCQTGLCTECASLVEKGMEHIELEAAILDPAVTAQGFVLTCSAHLTGSGVRMKLGVGEEFYEAQFSDLVDNHRKSNPMK